MHFAKHLISPQVVTGFPEQRLSYLSSRIQETNANYCAVLQPRTFELVGLVRFSNVAANPLTANRIFADLMQAPPVHQVGDFDPIDRVLDLLPQDPSEIVVRQRSGEFAGLITPNSFLRWLLSMQPHLRLNLEKVPRNSRWHPSPGPVDGTQELAG